MFKYRKICSDQVVRFVLTRKFIVATFVVLKFEKRQSSNIFIMNKNLQNVSPLMKQLLTFTLRQLY